MRKAIGLALAALLVSATAAFGYTVEGNLTVVDSTPTSVSVLVTASEPADLRLGVSCALGDHVFRFTEQRVTSGDVVVVSAEHKIKGQTVYADRCGIQLSERLGGKSYRMLDWFIHHF